MQKRRRFAGQYSYQQISGYRVFFLAIILSLAWHIFWLSAIRVVAASGPKSAVKFSRVSFLGPILAKETLGLRVEPKKLSFLEERYFKRIGSLINIDIYSGRGLHGAGDHRPSSGYRPAGEDELASLVDKAITGQKLEPDYAVDRRRFADMARP